MRRAFLRATTAILLLTGVIAVPAAGAGAASIGPYVDISPPAIVGAGSPRPKSRCRSSTPAAPPISPYGCG